MRQISFQNRSIEFEFVRLDRFCCPEALTIAVQYLCAVLLFSFFFFFFFFCGVQLNAIKGQFFEKISIQNETSGRYFV